MRVSILTLRIKLRLILIMASLINFFVTIVTVLITSYSAATSLNILNDTRVSIRIDSLFNTCEGNLISEDQPVYLQPGEFYFIPKIIPIMHHYKICGNGYCEMTAMPIRDDIDYLLQVVLEDDFLVSGIPTPDHWVGNTDCPKFN